MRRVVITGLGILSSIGNTQKEILNSLKRGKSCVSFSKEFQMSGMKSHVWGKINVKKKKIKNKKILRFINDSSFYAYTAMKQAISDAKLKKYMVSNKRTGLIIGSGGDGSAKIQFKEFSNMYLKKIKKTSPFTLIKTMPSNLSACLSTAFNIYGISYSISSACTSSMNCIGNALEIIRLGKQDIIFAGGSEELSWELAYKFDAMGALSTKFNNYPKIASRAYDIDRDGFVISGGSGILVLEELNHAINRNAKIYGEIIKYYCNSDGNHLTIPSKIGLIKCMKNTLKNIQIPIDYLNTHGTSTNIGDKRELIAIKETFGNDQPPFSSTKSMTGHALGASGVQEIIFTLMMLKNNFIAPSINIFNLEKEAKNMNLITHTTEKKITTIMKNSVGFGGNNVCLIIKKYNE